MVLYIDMLNVLSHISKKIPSGVAMRDSDGVAGEGKLVEEQKYIPGGKCTMKLIDIYSDWPSNAFSDLCVNIGFYFASWVVLTKTMPLFSSGQRIMMFNARAFRYKNRTSQFVSGSIRLLWWEPC